MASPDILDDIAAARLMLDGLNMQLQRHISAQVPDRPWYEVQERCDALRDARLDMRSALRRMAEVAAG